RCGPRTCGRNALPSREGWSPRPWWIRIRLRVRARKRRTLPLGNRGGGRSTSRARRSRGSSGGPCREGGKVEGHGDPQPVAVDREVGHAPLIRPVTRPHQRGGRLDLSGVDYRGRGGQSRTDRTSIGGLARGRDQRGRFGAALRGRGHGGRRREASYPGGPAPTDLGGHRTEVPAWVGVEAVRGTE